MSAPRGARQDGSKRFYQWRESRFYSVTTMLEAALRRYALEKWNKNKVAESVVRNPDLIALMISKCEAPDLCPKVADLIDLCPKCAAMLQWLKDAPYLVNQRAKDIGTTVHAAIDALQLGRPMPPWPVAVAPRMHQWERFVADWSPTFELSEATVFNRTESYAGTLDTICRIPLAIISPLVATSVGWTVPTDRDFLRLLIDYKSSQRGIYPEIALQLAAYRGAEFIGLPDGSEAPMPSVDGTAGLQLTDDTYNLIPVTTDADIFASFLYARELFRFAEVQSKQVLHPPLIPAKAEVAA
jgi:hypothetical protein